MNSGATETILYISSNRDSRRSPASKSLAEAGHLVRHAEPASAPAAIEERPALIVLDCARADSQVCQAAASAARSRSIPVLVLGAGSQTDPGLLELADFYVEQVSPVKVLLSSVEKALRNRRAAPEKPAAAADSEPGAEEKYALERADLLRQMAAEPARLEQVLHQLPLGVIMAVAPSGATLVFNQQVERIWGGPFRSAASIQDYGAWRGFHKAGKPYAPDEWPLARSIAAGEVVADEQIHIERADGGRGIIRVSSSPIRDHENNIVAAVMALQDVTERTQLEEQFRQSQKMDAVGRLAGGVAHDFNNLLTIIGGYAQMVAERLDPKDSLRRDVETVLEATERATQLTRQLLTFSRRQIIQPKSLDINRLVSRLHKILRRVIGEDIELKTSLASGLARVKADPGQLEQVILNLALNARDAMPKGGRITVETAPAVIGNDSARTHGTLAPGPYVLLSFRDTGTGIEPSILGQIFEPFFTTKPKGKGTGLGLSTVYGIIKQAGGDIQVESALGQGTVFRIYMPEDPDAPSVTRSGAAAKGTLKGTETILLVEDEMEVRRLTKEMLNRLGYTVLEAASAHDAVRTWEKHSSGIRMLLTDVVMPNMSGRELADRLKSERADLRVLFMSGYTDEVIARHGALEGSASFLQKPFTQEQLAKKVRNILDAR